MRIRLRRPCGRGTALPISAGGDNENARIEAENEDGCNLTA